MTYKREGVGFIYRGVGGKYLRGKRGREGGKWRENKKKRGEGEGRWKKGTEETKKGIEEKK